MKEEDFSGVFYLTLLLRIHSNITTVIIIRYEGSRIKSTTYKGHGRQADKKGWGITTVIHKMLVS